MIYDPPPGYLDVESDAEDAPASTGPFRPLEVDGIGIVMARKPMPNAVAVLAACADAKISDERKSVYQNRFVRNHLDDGEFAAILSGMIEGRHPKDAISRIAAAIGTWGTARPNKAVITLCVLTAHHWRVLRPRLINAGIADPMLLPSLHALLDTTEAVIMESIANNVDSEDAKRNREEFLDALYTPELTAATGDGYRPAPPGFGDDEMAAAFDAFASKAPAAR